jgi:hypothetical protein
MKRKRNILDLFRRHHGISQRSAELARQYEKRHPGYKPPEGKAKPHRSSSSSSERDQMRRDVISALRNLGYPAKTAQQAERQAKGTDFDSRFRSAAAAATFQPIKRGNPMAKQKRRKKKKNSRRARPRRRMRRNIAAGFYDEDGYFHPIRASYDYKPERAGEGRKRRKSRRRVKRANPRRPRIIKVGSVAMAKKLARKLQGMGYKARYVKR